jgi:hypothetical protein
VLKRNPAEVQKLNDAIAVLEDEMLQTDPGTEFYASMVGQLERLYKLRERHASRQIDPNTLMIVGGNLLGILVIVWHEQAHVITSKALSFAGKLR